MDRVQCPVSPLINESHEKSKRNKSLTRERSVDIFIDSGDLEQKCLETSRYLIHGRLRTARIAAGYPTALSASDYFGWKSSTYRAHENGQNPIQLKQARTYARAYRVSVAWLLFGGKRTGRANFKPNADLDMVDYVERIFVAASRLRRDPISGELFEELDAVVGLLKERMRQK